MPEVASAATVSDVVHEDPSLTWTMKPVSSDDSSVQESSALVSVASAALSPEGAGGGVLSVTSFAARYEPTAFRA